MIVISAPVICVLAAVFIVGGVEKFRNRRAFTRTLTGLQLGGVLVPVAAIGIPTVELITAVGLMLVPATGWPAAGVAVLGIAFAVAGLLGLRQGQPVVCSCLSAASDSYLGWRQVWMLPLWLAAAALIFLDPPKWTVLQGLQLLAFVVVAANGLHAVKVVKAWRADAVHRRAIEESSETRADIVTQLHVIGSAR